MANYKTSKAQRKASRNWEERNREQARKLSYLRTARLYFRTYADNEDVAELLDIYKKENPNARKKER